MIRYGQNNIMFLVNNRGYVAESVIHDGPYNYIKNWDYAGLIPAWNAEDGHGLGLKATTGGVNLPMPFRRLASIEVDPS